MRRALRHRRRAMKQRHCYSKGQRLDLMARVTQLILIAGRVTRMGPRRARRCERHPADARRRVAGTAEIVVGHFTTGLHDPVHLVLALPEHRRCIRLAAGRRILLGCLSARR